jgi:hypothetical protein
MSVLPAWGRWFRTARTAAPSRARANLPRRLLDPGLLGIAAAAGVLGVADVNPEQPGHYPVCPTLALTGFYCPGCGGLRAVHALAHGDLALALHRNPLIVLAVPFLAWAYVAWLRRRVLGRAATWYPQPALMWSVLAVVAGFTLLRNLPGFGWLAP